MAITKSAASYLQNMEEVQKVFNRFDANGDKKISADELAGVLKALGSDSSPDEVKRMMDEIDTDKDGHINMDEFAAFCAAAGDADGSPEEELKEAFALYDQDRNGKICTTELHQILTRLGERCTVEDCERMIRSVDSDGDGCVDFEEFKTMMTKSNV